MKRILFTGLFLSFLSFTINAQNMKDKLPGKPELVSSEASYWL